MFLWLLPNASWNTLQQPTYRNKPEHGKMDEWIDGRHPVTHGQIW